MIYIIIDFVSILANIDRNTRIKVGSNISEQFQINLPYVSRTKIIAEDKYTVER